MTTANTNPETGIRYGIIAANTLHSYLIDDIQSNGTDVRFEEAYEEEKIRLAEMGMDEYDTERALERFSDNWEDDEPVHEFVIDGVKGRTTWLGGALHVWIFESPIIGKYKLCSPCVPNCGDLDSPDPNGYECYDVPADWRDNEEC